MTAPAQQHLFDTELTHEGEPDIDTVIYFYDPNESATLGTLYDVLSTHATLFDRSRRRFEIGLNWGALDSRNLRTLFGVSVDDNRISSSRTVAENKLAQLTDDTRMIIVDDAFLWDEGFGMLTRIDPELGVDAATGRPVLLGGTSAALHAFAEQGNGSVQGEHVQLRRTQGASEYSRNTNNRV